MPTLRTSKLQRYDEFVHANANNLLYQLAETSPSLRHAILMVGASHLSIDQGRDGTSDHQIVHHKDFALRTLNEAVENLSDANYLECLATIAVLASHEVCAVYLVAFDVPRIMLTISVDGGRL